MAKTTRGKIMGLMTWKEYGMNQKERESFQDFKKQIQEHNQPERSKREDSCKHEWGSEENCDSKDPFYICSKCGHEMRCSELYGNIETEVR